MAKKPVKSKAKSTKSGAKSKAAKAKPAKAKTAAKGNVKPATTSKAAKGNVKSATTSKAAKTKAKPVPKPVSTVKPEAKPASKEAPKATSKAKAAPATSARDTSAPETNGVAVIAEIQSASKAAGNAGAITNSGPAWKRDLRAELAKLPDDFAAYCAERGASAGGAWEHADTDPVKGLEAWGRELAERDRRLGVAALVSIAQAGFPRAMKSAGDAAANMGFHASEESMDGAPVEMQIARGAAWLADPSESNLEAVVASLDPSRQLNVWNEDLLPQSEDQHWYWYSEVGQCIAHAISGEGGEAEGTTYYEWTPALSAARGMVMAVRGLRAGDNDAAVIAELRARMVD